MSKNAQLTLLITTSLILTLAIVWYVFLHPERLWRPLYLIKWSEVDSPQTVVEALKLRLYPIAHQHSGRVWVVLEHNSFEPWLRRVWPEVQVTFYESLPNLESPDQSATMSNILVLQKFLSEEAINRFAVMEKKHHSCLGEASSSLLEKLDCQVWRLLQVNYSRILKNTHRPYGFLLAQIEPSQYLWLVTNRLHRAGQ
ncbi:MAG: hypothetical protein NZ480_06575 [Bdellovibrionaceae bacterium]|nr:hypothetical protein [Pseudobdellovibrionaceae bacterium]MDW8190412.1 hypothetical protein [Pseudobdellovibrionaceae bacterium]